MSSSALGQTSTRSSDFKSILDAGLNRALSEYKKKTGKGLLDHPLAAEVQRSDSVDSILAIFRGQAEAFQQFRDGDQRLMKWISPVVDVLHRFSDTLGAVAGIAFNPAGAIFSGIGILLAAAKDVRASHDALVELFERIEDFFKRLGVYTQIPLTAEVAEVLVKIVAEIISILSIATKEVKRKRAKIYFRKLLRRTDIEDALKKLNGLIQKEVPMVMAETIKVVKGIEEDMKKLTWDKIERDVQKWFSPPDPSTNHNTACGVYNIAPPTWFFEARVFKGWMSNGSLLWVHGKPGSGKSILCSAIIQHIKELCNAGSLRATLAYFYFDFQDEEKQNVRNAVTSLLVQLSAYSKPCFDIIYQLYSEHGKGTQQPSNGILIDCLTTMFTVAGQEPVFIILDALDECPDLGMPTPREEVLNFVKVLVRLQLPNLHICATSRPEIDIQTMLKPLAVNAISLHDETRQKFVISNYVSSVVSSDERMRKWRDEDKKLVVEELSERADGMFQWVFCQLETLRHVVQPDVRAVLEKLPKTLDETYERVLRDIKENNREPARRLLHCLTVAVRPLRVEELAEILTFDFDVTEGAIPKFHVDRRPKDQEEAVLSLCSSLLTVIDNRGSRVVQFSHLSVKEFLTSHHLASSTGHLASYHVLPEPAHTIFAQVCLGLLLHSDDCNDNKSVKGSPLAEYAARHWVTHAQFQDVAPHVEDGMKSLFDLDKPHFAAWIALYDIDLESRGGLPSKIPSPLYYSSLYGFHGLVRHVVVKHPQHVNAFGGSYGFPLVAALCRNHFRVAEILLEYGGSVDIRDPRQQTALHKAIDQHDKATIEAVRFLLEHGADVNARRDDLWTPLHLAVNFGDLSVARMLLEHEVDASARNDDGQAPLHLLSRRETSQGRDDDGPQIAKLLLERGANVNVSDNDSATPLHLASYNNNFEIIRVLLEHGANTDAENDRGETPLQIVLRRNTTAREDGVIVARLLLEHGAKTFARDKCRISTSDLTCCFEKENIWEMLLSDGENFKPEDVQDQTAFWLWIEECGADGNVQDKYYTILLHSALYHGKLEMARTLLSRNVNSDAKNPHGETALHMVSRGRFQSQDGAYVARLLLGRGVNANAQDKDGNSPLHSASYSGKLEIARLLLNYGANADANNDRGETSLHRVSQGKYDCQADGASIAQLLLDIGVDVNVQDRNGVTPLHLACWWGKFEIAQLLLGYASLNFGDYRVRTGLHVGVEERPVNIKVQQKDHETALHFACFRGQPSIAQLLLDYGSQVDAKNYRGETPLHLVSRGEYDLPDDGVRVTELLLERGTEVNAQDKFEWTPLHSASNNGKTEIAQVLLSHGAMVNAENYLGETPLHLARRGAGGDQDGVHFTQLLLDGGADVNARDKRDWTPLHSASYYGRLEIAQVLLNHGADAKAEDGQGSTPLHQVSQGNFDSQEAGGRIAELFLERGVDANSQDNNRETPLHVASRCGRLEIVRVLLAHTTVKNTRSQTPSQLGLEGCRTDVNALAKNSRTPLHFACSRGSLDIARLLLDHGAEANAETDSGETALHAVASGQYESQEDGVRVTMLLLERGVDANVRDNGVRTPLHIASNYGKLEIVRLLLNYGAKVDAVDALGQTPLHKTSYASEVAGVGVTRLLLGRGGDVNAQSKRQETPLHFASYYGKFEIAQLLVDHGAEVAAVNEVGETPLHNVSCGKYDSEEAGNVVARLLLDRGGDVHAQTNQQLTPLHVASYNGKLEIARLLLDHGAKVDAMSDLGVTALHQVSGGNYDSKKAGIRVAQLLLERGGNVNARSNKQETPLHFASYNGKLEITRLFLQYGAKADAVSDLGETPLHKVSCGKYHSEEAGTGVARLLLERGGDVNAQSKKQLTPLHVASYNGQPEIARLLLDHGAKVNALSDLGTTALHQVSGGNYDSEIAGASVARLLLERGGDVNARRNDNWTPLHAASYTGKLEVAQLLLDRGAKVDSVDDAGNTPLHDASCGKYGSEESRVGVSRLLLDRGVDVNARTKQYQTALHVASYNGKLELAGVLLDYGAEVGAVDKFSDTPLHEVSCGKYNSEEAGVELARLLLKRGGDVNAQSTTKFTPLHVASCNGKLGIAQLLLDHGAKVDALSDLGITPLHQVSGGDYDSERAGVGIAQLLLERGGDVNAQSKKQRTPLHFASNTGKLEIARLLLNYGAKLDSVDDAGYIRKNLL